MTSSNAKIELALEPLPEEPAKEEKLELLSVVNIEQALDEEIAKLLKMQTQVIDKIKKLLNGSNGEIRTTEDLNNE